jgi:hypothetical protein
MKYGEGVSEASVKGKGLVSAVNANARFGVLSDAFLEEVCFALKADRFHPFERVPSFEVTVTAKAEKESVGAKFDVVAHHGPEGRSLYCLNLNCRAPPGRFFRSDLMGLVAGCLT